MTQTTFQISEILPNPEGKDQGLEWIEITNISQKTANLQNFTLDDNEKGSKPYLLGKIELAPGAVKVFYQTETKIALNNSDDMARLIRPDGSIEDYTEYSKTTEGQSISKIPIKTKASTKWIERVSSPTPSIPQKTLYVLEGTITTKISDEKLKMKEKSSGKEITILLAEKIQSKTDIKIVIFKEGSTLKILAEKISNNEFKIIEYKPVTLITQEVSQTETPKLQNTQISRWTIASLIIFLIILAILIVTILARRPKL